MREQRARAIFYVRVSPFPSLLASPFPSLAPSFDLSLGLSVSQFARLSTVAFFSSCMSTHASLPLSFSLSLSRTPLYVRCTYLFPARSATCRRERESFVRQTMPDFPRDRRSYAMSRFITLKTEGNTRPYQLSRIHRTHPFSPSLFVRTRVCLPRIARALWEI